MTVLFNTLSLTCRVKIVLRYDGEELQSQTEITNALFRPK